jgi:hypothetical protein
MSWPEFETLTASSRRSRSANSGPGDLKPPRPTQNDPSVVAGKPNSALTFLIVETGLCEPGLRHRIGDIHVGFAPMIDENLHHAQSFFFHSNAPSPCAARHGRAVRASHPESVILQKMREFVSLLPALMNSDQTGGMSG